MGGMSTNSGPEGVFFRFEYARLSGWKGPVGGVLRVHGALLGPEATGHRASLWGCLVDVVSVVPRMA